MKKGWKIITGVLIFVLILASTYGVFFFPSPEVAFFCGGLGLLGLLLAGGVYAACRSEMIQIAETLENTLMAAEQGSLPDAGAYCNESLTQRLSLRAVRLAESIQNNAKKQETDRAELQSAVSELAHQLRAPVANLTLYADTLATGDLPPEKQAEFLAVLGGQARKLEFLVDALVKTGRLETGAISMVPRTVSLKHTLEQAATLAKPLAEAKGLSFLLDCPEELFLLHDPKWTAEAVFNLLDNAIKYTEVGSVTLVARQWEMYTCMEVTDTGIGFAQEDVPQLFGRFFRATQTKSTPGVGLGLYIVRQIAQLQGGYVQAKALECGAVFRFFLPNTLPERRYQN